MFFMLFVPHIRLKFYTARENNLKIVIKEDLQCFHISHFIHVPQLHCPVEGAAEQLMCTPPECQTLQWRSKYSIDTSQYMLDSLCMEQKV